MLYSKAQFVRSKQTLVFSAFADYKKPKKKVLVDQRVDKLS
jgi:hypothetical protein